MKKIVLLSSMILASATAIAKDCEAGATVQGEVIACYYESELMPLERQVDAAFSSLLRIIKRNKNVSEETAQSLVDAQTNWSKYKDSTCDFVYNKAGGVTVMWGERLTCLIDFTKARIHTLQRYKQEVSNNK